MIYSQANVLQLHGECFLSPGDWPQVAFARLRRGQEMVAAKGPEWILRKNVAVNVDLVV